MEMCSEGGCCGPCCSTRSWLVTHVVFVMICAIGSVITIRQMAAVKALLLESRSSYTSSSSNGYSYGYINGYSNSYSNGYTDGYSNGDIVTLINFVQTILIVQVIAIVVRIVWSILGWVLVCGPSSKRVHFAYVVCCGIDLVITICSGIVTAVMLGELSGKLSGIFDLTTLVVSGIVSIAIMDIAPMLCFCICQKKTLSKYSDGVDLDRLTGQGAVYAASPQTTQVYPDPNAAYPDRNATDPHGSNGPPGYTEVQKV